MKIFIQKSNRLIRYSSLFNSTYCYNLSYLKKKFSQNISPKIIFPRKFPKNTTISSKIEFSKRFQFSKEASIFETFNSSWRRGGKKIREDWKKVSYALRIQSARSTFPSPISSPRNGYRARQFAKQPRRSISSTRSVATRDPERSTSGLLEARAFRALQLPVRHSSNAAPAR